MAAPSSVTAARDQDKSNRSVTQDTYQTTVRDAVTQGQARRQEFMSRFQRTGPFPASITGILLQPKTAIMMQQFIPNCAIFAGNERPCHDTMICQSRCHVFQEHGAALHTNYWYNTASVPQQWNTARGDSVYAKIYRTQCLVRRWPRPRFAYQEMVSCIRGFNGKACHCVTPRKWQDMPPTTRSELRFGGVIFRLKRVS